MVIRVVPILHDRLDVAAWVRRHLAESEPAAVAVELPTTLETAVLQAVRRLPRISLVVSEEPGEEALVWTVTPGDPIAEALRWALERQRPVFFIDPDVPYAERHAEPVPDPYALWQVGPERYFALLADALSRAPATRADEIREAGMAHHLEQARRHLADEGAAGEILALVGAAHARRLEAGLGRPTAIPFARTRRTRVTVRHLHPESLTALLPDPPLAHAVFELSRGELPPEPPSSTTPGKTVDRPGSPSNAPQRSRSTSYSLWTRPPGSVRVVTCRSRMSRGVGPKRGMPVPMRMGRRVRTMRSISPSFRNPWIVSPPST